MVNSEYFPARHDATIHLAQEIEKQLGFANTLCAQSLLVDTDEITVWRGSAEGISFTCIYVNYRTGSVKVHAIHDKNGIGVYAARDAQHLWELLSCTSDFLMVRDQ